MSNLHLYRPVQRPTRRVRVLRQRIGELTWTPDTWTERLEAWEWNHPLAAALLTLVLLVAVVGVFWAFGTVAA